MIFAAKLGFVGRALRFVFGWIGPLARESVRLIYRVFDRGRR